MTTRHAGYVVTLEDDVPEEYGEQIVTALRQIRGVVSVVPVEAKADDVINRERVNAEWRSRLCALLKRAP